MDIFDGESTRDQAARAAYLRWRMNDLPAVYTAMMPASCDCKYLWHAERAIRRQFAEDQKLAASPWRRVGPPCLLLDKSDMTPEELIEFGLEIDVPVGMADVPKPGFERHPEVLAAIEAAEQTPERRKARARSELLERMKTMTAEERETAAEAFRAEWNEPMIGSLDRIARERNEQAEHERRHKERQRREGK